MIEKVLANGRSARMAFVVAATACIVALSGCSGGGEKPETEAAKETPAAASIDINTPEGNVEETALEEVVAEKEFVRPPVNVLFVGLDKYRAPDTAVLANISFGENGVNLVSIPRTTVLSVPTYKNPRKFRYAKTSGDNLAKAVGDLIGVDVEYFVVLNLDAAAKVVDALGGVEINVEQNMKYTDKQQGLYIDLRQGEQTLNGSEALQYSRFARGSKGERGRTERQLKLVQAMVSKAGSTEIIQHLPAIVKTLIENPVVKTNLTASDALSLIQAWQGGTLDNVHGEILAGRKSGSNYLPDNEALIVLKKKLSPEIEAIIIKEETPESKSDSEEE